MANFRAHRGTQDEFGSSAVDPQTLAKPRPFLCLREIPGTLGKSHVRFLATKLAATLAWYTAWHVGISSQILDYHFVAEDSNSLKNPEGL